MSKALESSRKNSIVYSLISTVLYIFETAQELPDLLNVFPSIRIDYLLRFYAYFGNLELVYTTFFPKLLRNMEELL